MHFLAEHPIVPAAAAAAAIIVVALVMIGVTTRGRAFDVGRAIPRHARMHHFHPRPQPRANQATSARPKIFKRTTPPEIGLGQIGLGQIGSRRSVSMYLPGLVLRALVRRYGSRPTDQRRLALLARTSECMALCMVVREDGDRCQRRRGR
jgi:hypothetical protein